MWNLFHIENFFWCAMIFMSKKNPKNRGCFSKFSNPLSSWVSGELAGFLNGLGVYGKICFFWVFGVWVLFDIYVTADKFFYVLVCWELLEKWLIILVFLWLSYWIICRRFKNFDRKFCPVFGLKNFWKYRWKNLRWKKFLVWWKILKKFWVGKNFKNLGWNFGFFLGCEKVGKLGGFLRVRNWKNFGVVVNGLWLGWGGVGGVTDFYIFGVFWSFEFFGGVWYICVKV